MTLKQRSPTEIIAAANRLPLGQKVLLLGLGTIALVVILAVATLALHVAITLVTLGVYLAILAAFWYFGPVVLRQFRIWRMLALDAQTRANPIEALEMQEDDYLNSIRQAETNYAQAKGSIDNMRRVASERSKDATPEQKIAWDKRIADYEAALIKVKDGIAKMRKEAQEFHRTISSAKAEVEMTNASNSVNSALNKAGGTVPQLSHDTEVALNSISSRLSQSQAQMEMSLERMQQMGA